MNSAQSLHIVFASNGNIRCFSADREHPSLLKASAESGQPIISYAPAGEFRWTFDDNEHAPMWEGECGAAWCFIDGGPVENDMHYCPNCGRRCVPEAVKDCLTTDNDGNPLPGREGGR